VSFESWNYDTFCFMGGGSILNENLEPTIHEGASPQMLGYFAQLIADGKSPNPVVAGGTVDKNDMTHQTQAMIAAARTGEALAQATEGE
ncbi:MAG: hypothetical protein MI747_12585, partial [Desulfobacterales bacterium]|nr:hypothetical protein [Desulfobacterales bacterium]